ncbi:unnamed protein product [Phaeothamnion confervicola]
MLLPVVCKSAEVQTLVRQEFLMALGAFPICCLVWTWDKCVAKTYNGYGWRSSCCDDVSLLLSEPLLLLPPSGLWFEAGCSAARLLFCPFLRALSWSVWRCC